MYRQHPRTFLLLKSDPVLHLVDTCRYTYLDEFIPYTVKYEAGYI